VRVDELVAVGNLAAQPDRSRPGGHSGCWITLDDIHYKADRVQREVDATLGEAPLTLTGARSNPQSLT
jgi:hypothetical protein